uniref:aminotransferase class I/II-fold pyridoxal phosphate-dependent enzyme n=1 Tax=Yoonia sp. TaxID=2212373 RepID=UPI0040482830
MSDFLNDITGRLADIRAEGLWKTERLITTPQAGHIAVGGRDMINLCANNYLGLANHPALISAAKQAMDDHGYGMASVRFICGTQDLHRQLEDQGGPAPKPDHPAIGSWLPSLG